MANKRNAILELHRQGKRQCDIVRLLGVRKDVISKAVKRFKELGHEGDRPGRGRKRTVNTPRNRQIIKKRVQRNSRVSMRKIARETGISDRSVRRMAKQELELKPFQCDLCDATFSARSALKRHMMTHTSEKSFKCDLCDAAFSRKYCLKRHVVTHSGE